MEKAPNYLSRSDSNTIIEWIRYLSNSIHQNAIEKGFWEDEDELLEIIDSFNLSRIMHHTNFEKVKNRIISLFNSEKVALEHSEISEFLETSRKDPLAKDEHCPEFLSLEIEAADAIIRILDKCERRKLRIGEAIIAKHNYNLTRPYKHGKEF